MYFVRNSANLSKSAKLIGNEGIFLTQDIYSVNEIGFINSTINPIFNKMNRMQRSYIYSNDMLRIGILNKILSHRMCDLLLSIIPDPVLYHLHIYEISAGKTQSHIFADNKLLGWHRDRDCAYYENDPTHISVFVYLSDVGVEDGPFEFVPQKPTHHLETKSPAVSMTGPIGTSFAWHRSFYHRAAPNRGDKRRRVLKISVQRNCFPSTHLKKDHFQKTISQLSKGNEMMDLLFGRFQGREAPTLVPSQPVFPESVDVQETINLPEEVLRRTLTQEKIDQNKPVDYD